MNKSLPRKSESAQDKTIILLSIAKYIYGTCFSSGQPIRQSWQHIVCHHRHSRTFISIEAFSQRVSSSPPFLYRCSVICMRPCNFFISELTRQPHWRPRACARAYSKMVSTELVPSRRDGANFSKFCQGQVANLLITKTAVCSLATENENKN